VHARMDAQVAEIRRIWAGEPPFAGGDPVGPTPVQAGGPPILAGVMGPRATRRAAAWADGVYSWSGNGEAQEIGQQLQQVRAAWQAEDRSSAPRHVAGFWYSLAPDAQTRLSDYVYKYVALMGDEVARAMAKSVNRSQPDLVREALDGYEELGVEECLLNSATADPAEIEGLLEVLEKRG